MSLLHKIIEKIVKWYYKYKDKKKYESLLEDRYEFKQTLFLAKNPAHKAKWMSEDAPVEYFPQETHSYISIKKKARNK